MNTQQNLICIAIGAFSLVWGVIIKLIMPASLFEWLAVNEKEMTEAESEAGFVTALRQSFRKSMVKRIETNGGKMGSRTNINN